MFRYQVRRMYLGRLKHFGFHYSYTPANCRLQVRLSVQLVICPILLRSDLQILKRYFRFHQAQLPCLRILPDMPQLNLLHFRIQLLFQVIHVFVQMHLLLHRFRLQKYRLYRQLCLRRPAQH